MNVIRTIGSKSRKFYFGICLIFLLLISGVSFPEADDALNETVPVSAVRYRVLSVRNITAQKASDYLKTTSLDVTIQILNDKMLSISGDSRTLFKAAEITRLVDTERAYMIKTFVIPEETISVLPTIEELSQKTGGTIIGSFEDLPAGIGPKAIIDLQDNKLFVAAPISIFSHIEQSITEAITATAPKEQEPNEPEQITILSNTVVIDLTESANDINIPEVFNDVNEPEVITDVNAVIDINVAVTADVNITNAVDVNDVTPIDANDLTADEVNDISLDSVLGKLVTSLERPDAPVEVNKPQIEQEVEMPAAKRIADVHTEQVQESQKTTTFEEELADSVIVTETEPQKETEIPTEQQTQQQVPEKETQVEPETFEQEIKTTSYEPESLPDEDEPLGITLPETLLIEDLLRLAGETLGLNYIYDPTIVKGEVTLRMGGRLQGEMTKKELYQVIEYVLKMQSLAMTRNNNIVIIAPASQVKDIDPKFVDPSVEGVRFGDVIINRIFELNYIDADSAKNLITSMKLAEADNINTSASEAGIIIVTAFANRMARIQALLNLIDIAGPEKEFRHRQLKYTIAANMTDKIKSLADQLGNVSITISAQAPSGTPQQTTRGLTAAQRRAQAAAQARQRTAAQQAAAAPSSAAGDEETVFLDADERTNRILMIGLPEQLDVVESLIDTLDVKQVDVRSIRVYDIINVDAVEVVNKLQELGIISSTTATTTGRTGRATQQRGGTAAQQRAAAGATTPPAGGRITVEEPQGIAESPSGLAPLAEEPQVVIIESTNSLLVNATNEQHMQIAVIIGYVDSQPEQPSINYIVYPLENQDPEDLASLLNQLIQETIERTDASGKVVGTETTRKLDDDITILPDKNTFSIIVYASKKNQQWIESLIRQLDKRRPQVLIDVTLVEISKTQSFEYDLNLISSIPDLTYTSGLTGEIVGGVSSGGIIDLLNASDSDRNKFLDFQSNSGNFTGFYGDKKIHALFKAMESRGYGRVLARPKLLVNDNETGTIQTTDTTYIRRTETSYIGVENPQATEKTVFEDYSAGITLNITPHISEGEMLRLDITMNRSDFGQISGEKPPDKANTDITTIVTVPNKSTIILGGMERINQSKGGSKVPIIGDIPLIGGLFRSANNSDIQKKLYIFVKAYTLRASGENMLDDLKVISLKNREEFEKEEKEMQEYEDWPGIKPKPMDPVNILEED